MCAGKIFNKNNTSSISKLKENLLINENVINSLKNQMLCLVQ